MPMRLTLSALLCAALLGSPALAHNHDGQQMPPPPGFDDRGPGNDYDGPGYGDGHGDGYGDDRRGPPIDPRYAQDQERMRGEWRERCGHHGDDRTEHDAPVRDDCRYPGPQAPYGYGYPGAYPGAYMGYAVPMIMVPVLRSKPCPQVVEEYVEEIVPIRRRLIRPRARVIHDKRVPMDDKRVRMAPTKRITY